MGLPDLGPLWLTIRLAAIATMILLVIGTPVASTARRHLMVRVSTTASSKARATSARS